MQHNFAEHAYTIGIEEELMILDADSLELANAIETLIEPAPAGEIKPELMESVLEITDPCADIAQAGEQLRGDGLPDPYRALTRAGRPGSGADPRARRALRFRQATVALSVRDPRREQVAGRAPRAGR